MRTGTAIGMCVLASLLAGAGGFAYGQDWGLERGLEWLGQETSLGLSVRVEAASRIRVGDTDGALALLDDDIDGAVLNSAGNERYYQPSALAMAKVYRGVIPSSAPQAGVVDEVLKRVEAPAPGALMLCRRAGKPCESASGLLELMRTKDGGGMPAPGPR